MSSIPGSSAAGLSLGMPQPGGPQPGGAVPAKFSGKGAPPPDQQQDSFSKSP